MPVRRQLAGCAVALAIGVAFAPLAAADDPGATAATLRTAAARIITALLTRDGAGACAVLNAPLTATERGRTCAQRWDARSAELLARRNGAALLHADLREAATVSVSVDGEHGSIALSTPLLNGHSRFYWTQNCWMLTR
ncbi:MAG TPA: hypothetical protein VHX66_17100 [Solirubrobacteraceae bacterium]|jgi:hypothetical protein|nr:hypothetical protein [Solirubrobacteraceae bacterium]